MVFSVVMVIQPTTYCTWCLGRTRWKERRDFDRNYHPFQRLKSHLPKLNHRDFFKVYSSENWLKFRDSYSVFSLMTLSSIPIVLRLLLATLFPLPSSCRSKGLPKHMVLSSAELLYSVENVPNGWQVHWDVDPSVCRAATGGPKQWKLFSQCRGMAHPPQYFLYVPAGKRLWSIILIWLIRWTNININHVLSRC